VYRTVRAGREGTVLNAVTKGMSKRATGIACNIAEDTLDAHFTNIPEKLQIAARTKVVTTAIKRGMIHLQ
jgi:DNA-binding NarL/FixJ family response regulator